MSVEIRTVGGNCPVQAWGTVDGLPWYFRARGRYWSIELESETERASVGGRYGPAYSAGWISENDARAIIEVTAPMLKTILTLPNRRGEPDQPVESFDVWLQMQQAVLAEQADAVETIFKIAELEGKS